MDKKDRDSLNKIFKIIKDSCGNDVEIDPSLGAAENKCKNANLDILFGFQDTNPLLFTVIAEMMANEVSGTISASSLNALGNWLQLIAQVIEAFNAQQEYQQGGPGRYYDPVYKNVTNPMCRNEFETDGKSEIRKRKGKRRGKEDGEKNKTSSSNEKRLLNLINDLNEQVSSLKQQVESLQNQIDTLKKKM